MSRCRSVLSWLVVVCAATAASAGQTAPYNADLSEFELPPPADGVYDVSLALWTEAAGGELVWEEEFERVPVEDSRFSVLLGATRPLPADADRLWLEARIAGQALWPRQRSHLNRTVAIDGSLGVRSSIAIGTSEEDHFEVFMSESGAFVHNFAATSISMLTSTVEGQSEFRLTVEPSGLVKLHGGGDASLTQGSGYLVIGNEGGDNLVLDDNELMARNSGSESILYLQNNGGAVYVNGSMVHASDARLKREVRDLERGLATVLALRPVSYAWENGDERRHFGLIAQEVRRLSDDLIYENEDGYLGVAYTDLVPLIIRALQEQQQRIEQLQATSRCVRNN